MPYDFRMRDAAIEEMRNDTFRYAEDPAARIPCPDCAGRPGLDIAEDQPAAAAILSYCPLCDGARSVTKARALAVLPRCAENVRRMRELLRKHGRHLPDCEMHPDRLASRRTPQYDGDGRPEAPQCGCGLEDVLAE